VRGFYASEEWARLKAACKARDGYRCRRCGWRAKSRWDRSRLHAHHLIPRDSGGPDRLDNLETLCVDCHSDEHGSNGGLRAQASSSYGQGARPYSARLARRDLRPSSASPNLYKAKRLRIPKRFT